METLDKCFGNYSVQVEYVSMPFPRKSTARAGLLPQPGLSTNSDGTTLLETNHHKTTFIISTGRTGTKAIAQYLTDCYEGVTALHEPRPSWRLRLASNARLANRKTPDQLARLLANSRREICSRITTEHYVESNPFLFGFIDVLADVFPQPSLLHIVRDPRTMIRSALNFRSQRGIKWLFSRFVPNWIIKPELMESGPSKTWAQMSLVERIAWYWATVNRHIQTAAEQAQLPCKRKRFEDLFQADGSGVRELADWLQLVEKPGTLDQMLKQKVNASSSNEISLWDQWSKEERQIVYEYCGELMADYGYSVD